MHCTGRIGYLTTVETSPGIWSENIVEVPYYGEFISIHSRFQEKSKLNDDISLDQIASIVVDPTLYANFMNIKYMEYLGVKWKISSVEPRYPRLILTLGGVYNAP